MSSATAAASTPTVPLSAAPALVAPAGRLQPAPRWALWSAFAVIYLVWGSTFLGIRVAVETLPPLTMSGFRFLVAGGILLLVTARVRPQRATGGTSWWAGAGSPPPRGWRGSWVRRRRERPATRSTGPRAAQADADTQAGAQQAR